jgi:hypothetical protein
VVAATWSASKASRRAQCPVGHRAITNECHHATTNQCTSPETFRETEGISALKLANSTVLPSGDQPFAYRTAQIPTRMPSVWWKIRRTGYFRRRLLSARALG